MRIIKLKKRGSDDKKKRKVILALKEFKKGLEKRLAKKYKRLEQRNNENQFCLSHA